MFSCKKEISSDMPQDVSAIFPTEKKDIEKVSLLREVSIILKEVYKDPKAYREVNATIYSGYYEDERVLLKDLLFPETSVLYKTKDFKKFQSGVGIFKQRFVEELDKGNYPALKHAIPSQNYAARENTVVPTDTAAEIFSNSSGVSIYFPYSENFGSNFTAAYFDNINTDPFGNMATVIPADREADSAPGDEPYRYKTYDSNGEIVWQIRYKPVTVNDAYAEIKISHIAGVGAQQRTNPSDPPIATNINRVFVGWTRINNGKHYDKLISFNKENGGGADIKVCRVSGYLQFQNQQVTSFTGDVFDVRFKRRQENRGIWKRIYGVWDPNWEPSNNEQIMAIYEEDNEGTQTFNGSLTTTLTIPATTGAPSGTTTGTIGYSVQVKSQDELVLQSKWSRTAYFGAAKSDQGWGFVMCDTKGGDCRSDNTFLTTGNWPIFNGGANWNFTWPYNSY